MAQMLIKKSSAWPYLIRNTLNKKFLFLFQGFKELK